MARKHARRNDGGQGPLVLLHVGDLHLTGADAPSARDLRAILDQIGQLPRHIYDFVYLPGTSPRTAPRPSTTCSGTRSGRTRPCRSG